MYAVTHNGNFHADDLLSAAFLRVSAPNLTILRSRDPEVLAGAKLVFDVGGLYAPTQGRFDHHFKDSPARENGIPYSSIGMLWKHFGQDTIRRVSRPKDVREQDYLFNWVDTNLISAVDAVDVGIGKTPDQHGLSYMLCALNPNWDEIATLEVEAFEAMVDKRFETAQVWLQPALVQFFSTLRADPARALAVLVETTKSHTQQFSHQFHLSLQKAREIIKSKVLQETHAKVLFLDNPAYPWDIIVPAMKEAEHLKYVVYPTPSGQWRCQCIPTAPGGFVSRQPFPDKWRGLSESALASVTGIHGAKFCHPAGFLMGLKTKTALQELLAKIAA